MISTRRSISDIGINRESPTVIKILNINPRHIIESALRTNMKKIGDTVNSRAFNARSSADTGRKLNLTGITNHDNIDNKKLFTFDLSKVLIRDNISNNPYSQVYSGKKIYCTWDRHEIDSDIIFPSPVKIKIESDNLLIVWGIDHHCSMECCLAYLNDEEDRLENRRDPVYKDAKANLFILFDFINKHQSKSQRKDNLIPANHWNLLSGHGNGDMDIKKFRMISTIYRKIDDIKYYPIQQVYEA